MVAVMRNGMVAMEVEIEAEAADDSVNRELCVLVNGSSVGCGPVGARPAQLFTEQLLFPVTVLNQGSKDSWFSVELVDSVPSATGDVTRVIQASTLPIRVRVQSRNEESGSQSLLNSAVATSTPPSMSLVLTLTLRDLPRAASLFASLAHQLKCDNSDEFVGNKNASDAPSEPCWLEELLVVVPDGEAAGVEALIGDDVSGAVRVIREGSLLPKLRAPLDLPWDTYAVAMALKLLVASIVTTDYYITLDADVLVTKRFGPRDLFEFDDATRGAAPRALFVHEPQIVHPHWWAGSAATLNFKDQVPGNDDGALEIGTSSSSSLFDSPAGFGVTPAVLSTGGALMTLASLREAFQQRSEAATEQQHLAWVGQWLSSWGPGKWWSEYTLYALVLQRHLVFQHLHTPSTELTCHSAWFAGDLPWDATAAFRSVPTCFFAVVQSSSGADPSLLAAAVTEELLFLDRDSRSDHQPQTLASIFKQKSKPQIKTVAIDPALPAT